jgi:hypothetical protein
MSASVRRTRCAYSGLPAGGRPLQGKAWYYIELCYYEQGQEDAAYVRPSFLDGIARQIPGLSYTT